jgi:phage terminase Nu1 subunit (DNA packaging protein)
VPEHLTASQLRERLDLERNEFDRLGRNKIWPKARTKDGDRYPWPAALHAYVQERERVARAELPEFVSGEQLGAIINRVAKTLHNYQKAGIPHQAQGRHVVYPLAAAVQWCLDYISKANAEGDGKGPSLKKQKEHEDMLTARNKRVLSDIEVAEKQGRIVTLDFLRVEVELVVMAVRDVLVNLPSDLADRVLGLDSKAKARAVLRAGVDKAMTALRDALTRVAERAFDELEDEDAGALAATGVHDADEEEADDADDAS